MDLILAIILLMIAGWLTNAFKASLFLCLGSVLTLSGAFFLIGFVSQTFFLVMLALSLLTGCVMGIAPLRRLLVTGPIYKATRRSTKSISETEKIALSAGDSWLEADIFQGKLDLKKVLASEVSSLSKEEQDFLDNETEELCKLIDDWKIMNSDYDLDPKTWAYIKTKGFLGLVIAPEYGGKGFSAAAHSAIVKKIATKSITAAITVMVPNSLGPGELLSNYGTAAQKKKMLPSLASGEEIPCFGLTGTYAGSDATSMTDTGKVCFAEYEGKKQLGIKLNFAKRYITLAPIATLIGLAFKLEDPDKLLGGIGKEGITLCLIPSNQPGVNSGNRHLPLGIPFMNGPITGKDVFIPIDFIIGGQKMAGNGWKMLVECLAIGRSISLPAICDAYNSNSLLLTSAYAALREQFSTPIVNFEGVAAKVGNMAGLSYITRATRLFTLTAVDNGLKPGVASAIAKYHLTEISRVVINHAMDVHGGKAIMSGKHNYMATAHQGLPICITVEGANILTRNLIIFGQGAVRSHPYIFGELEALSSPAKDGLKVFDKLVMDHLGYLIHNWSLQGLHTVTAGKLIKAPEGKMNHYYKQITRLSLSYAALADFALVVLGSKLKQHERLSARLGDVMSHLYMAIACLHYYHANGEKDEELLLVTWAVDTSIFEAQEAILNFCENFPSKITGKILKLKIFPWGRPYKKPNDTTDHELAKLITYNPIIRKSFAEGICYGEEKAVGTQVIVAAYEKLLSCKPILEKIKNAHRAKKLEKLANGKAQAKEAFEKKVINAEELKLILQLEDLRDQALAVDIFSNDLNDIIGQS